MMLTIKSVEHVMEAWLKLKEQVPLRGAAALEELREVLEQVREALPDWRREVPEARGPYGRRVLFEAPWAELVLIHIPAGSATYIHDHGASIGCGVVLEGSLVNRLYRLDEFGYPVLRGERAIPEGGDYAAPIGQIHQLANPGHSRAVSLHLYAPRLGASKTYYPFEQVLDFVI